ncbi:hypothetical protein [Paenibacillus sp.]|uniref:hypothetical protein n=1 Tax=Paenibacillus sp. TaxID=58172 RepID=UPI00281190B9|nr:hypothetical protein [Paenibacillus sp.]
MSSRNHKRFEKELAAKGYTITNAHWQPFGGNVEMIGREGGWGVKWNAGEFREYVFGYSAEVVLSNIDKLGMNAG